MEDQIKTKYDELIQKMGFYYGRLIADPIVAPEHVYFVLTGRCNLRCKMCDIVDTPTKEDEEISLKKVKEVIDQIQALDCTHLILSGGEPFLRKDLFRIVEYATKRIHMVDLISNGLLLDDEKIEKLIDLKLNHITISLDGVGKIHDDIRGKGNFAKTEAAIDRINFYKKKKGSTSPSLGINFTIMRKNISDILPMIDFAREKKCNILVFQPVLCSNTKMYEQKVNDLWPTEYEINHLTDILNKVVAFKESSFDLDICTDINVLNMIPAYFQNKLVDNGSKCYEAIKRIVITADAKVWSCLGVYGDLNQQSLSQIWSSPQARKIRERTQKCKKHCLQDCVYFPLNIWEVLNTFLTSLTNSDTATRSFIRDDVTKRFNNYLDLLNSQKKRWILFAGKENRLERIKLKEMKKLVSDTLKEE